MEVLLINVILYSLFLISSNAAPFFDEVKLMQCDQISPTIRRMIKYLDKDESKEQELTFDEIKSKLKSFSLIDDEEKQKKNAKNIDTIKTSFRNLDINENSTIINKTTDTTKRDDEKTSEDKKQEKTAENERKYQDSTEINKETNSNESIRNENSTEIISNSDDPSRLSKEGAKMEASDDKQTSKEDSEKNNSKEKHKQSKDMNEEENVKKDESELQKIEEAGNETIKKNETSHDEIKEPKEMAREKKIGGCALETTNTFATENHDKENSKQIDIKNSSMKKRFMGPPSSTEKSRKVYSILVLRN